jgi:biotin transport system substrate-specific component
MNFDVRPVSLESRHGSQSQTRLLRHMAAIGLGAAIVALSAQVVVPVPFSPVPMTLQPLAVLVVGGLLGPGRGAGALALYLALGIVGLPVFAGGGAGALRLIGPTGGYLLAFPLAAAATGGLLGHRTSVLQVLLACMVGMLIIHLGGAAWLAILGQDAAMAIRIGVLPFLAGDLLKIGLAAAVILTVGPRLRQLL